MSDIEKKDTDKLDESEEITRSILDSSSDSGKFDSDTEETESETADSDAEGAEDGAQGSEESDENDNGRHTGRRSRLIAGIIVVAAIVVSLVLYGIFRTYTDYEDTKTVKITSESGTEYAEFQGNLIKYSRDGVSCTDFDGNVLWSDSFEMDAPNIASYGGYFMLYDKGGSLIEIMKKSGIVKKITTTAPIVEADIASKGTSAVLMTGAEGSSVSLYDVSGNILATGSLHISNTGYPISLALSGNGEDLMVSLLDIKDGTLKSTIEFYNFGSAGKKQKNNITGTFSYSDMVIPRVDYIAGNRPVAFGDSEIDVFSVGSKPEVFKKIFVKGNIKSVTMNETYFSVITTNPDSTLKKKKDELALYSATGRQLFSEKIDDTYLDFSLLSNNILYISDGKTISLYNTFGVKKVKLSFDNGISAVIPWDGSSNYIFIENGKLHKVKLK